MAVRQMTRDEWLQGIRSRIEPVGDCQEWSGPYCNKGLTPVVYCPRGYAYEASNQERLSLRAVLWAMENGQRLASNKLIRSKCGNHRCVAHHHWLVLDRAGQALEQSRRGELSTSKAVAAKMLVGRGRAKLTIEQVREIRLSGIPAKQEAAKYAVSAATINAIRRGAMWRDGLPGASVFTLGHAVHLLGMAA